MTCRGCGSALSKLGTNLRAVGGRKGCQMLRLLIQDRPDVSEAAENFPGAARGINPMRLSE